MIMAITITMVIIKRAEVNVARKAVGDLLIYGRRKVGKTFLVQNFLSPDIYVLVKRGGGFYLEGTSMENLDSYEQFKQLLRSWKEEGKTVAIDEFQRLPDEFLDHLQTLKGHGKLILTGSSFRVVKDVVSPKSPVLGLLSDLKISLIQPVDVYRGLCQEIKAKTAMELSPYLQDPWIIPYYEPHVTELKDILRLSKGAIKALIGEVFIEEERNLSYVYEGIIRGLSLGKWRLAEIADLLYSRNVIKKPNPHLIRPYFNNMEEMDLVTKIPIYGKKEFMYKVRSPFMELGFMLDERFNFFQKDVSDPVLTETIENRMPHHLEHFCGEMFAQIYDGNFEYFYSKDFDIDFIITRGKKVLAAGEVKWTEKASKKYIDLFIERTKHMKGDKIFVSKNSIKDERVISFTPETILKHIT